MVRGIVHVAVRQDGRVLEGDGLAAAAALVRTLLRVVHLKQTEREFWSMNRLNVGVYT